MTADILQTFAEQLQSAGLLVEHVEADGALHRCPVDGKPYGRDGAYKAFTDSPVTLWWMNWRIGDEGTWTARSERDMTAAQRTALRERMAAARESFHETLNGIEISNKFKILTPIIQNLTPKKYPYYSWML